MMVVRAGAALPAGGLTQQRPDGPGTDGPERDAEQHRDPERPDRAMGEATVTVGMGRVQAGFVLSLVALTQVVWASGVVYGVYRLLS